MTAARDAVKEQFRAWYQHQIPRLFNYVSYWVQDRALAEDLTAAICERALQELDRYNPRRGSLDAWIFGIARNALRMHFRSKSRQPPYVSLDAVPDVRSTASSIEEQLEQVERFREVMQHVARLSPQEQEALSLRFGAGLSNTEVAHLMGISTNQVGVVLHRALSKLRHAVRQTEEAEK